MLRKYKNMNKKQRLKQNHHYGKDLKRVNLLEQQHKYLELELELNYQAMHFQKEEEKTYKQKMQEMSCIFLYNMKVELYYKTKFCLTINRYYDIIIEEI